MQGQRFCMKNNIRRELYREKKMMVYFYFYTSHQSLTIMFSYSLASQLWGLILKYLIKLSVKRLNQKV